MYMEQKGDNMTYIIHAPKKGEPVDLRGDASKDLVAVRFDATYDQMVDLMFKILKRRKSAGLETADLYLSEEGYRVVTDTRGTKQ